MKFFGKLYSKVVSWVERPNAKRYLYLLSFAESAFFPVPPEAMMVPICTVQPQQALRIALNVTLCSVAGGLLGYAIGMFLFHEITPFLESRGYWSSYQQAIVLFEQWGLWIILIAAFSPIPYKLFTIAAGALEQNLLIFVIASLIGRGARFLLVALLVKYASPRLLPYFERRIELFGWSLVAVLLVIIIFYSVPDMR